MTALAATVTSKGQITIPLAVRAELKIAAGSRVLFYPHPDGYRLGVEQNPLDELEQLAVYSGPTISLEDMEDAVDEVLSKRWAAQ